MKNYLSLLLIVVLFSVSSCTHKQMIDQFTDTIARVQDGGTVILNTGLTVHLCGLNPYSSYCKEQLEKFVGEEIELTHDTEGEEYFSDFDDEIDAYARVTSSGVDLNRYILSSAGERDLYTSNCSDSLAAFRKLVNKPIPDLDDEQMCAMLRSCSMLVFGTDGDKEWIGTAFFISKDGLALSCDHVINHGTINKVCISNSKGEMNLEQGYDINSIVHSDKDLDYVIFYVNLDDEARRNLKFMPLAKKEPDGGSKVGVMGNPLGQENLLMSYSSGTVSGIRKDEGKIQINAPITHGFSGGPVCNNHGEIIGIAQSVIETEDAGSVANLNFAVDILRVRQWLDASNKAYAGK
jgi:S1-C subfamily serine protease